MQMSHMNFSHKNKTNSNLGFWSALFTAAANLWFFIAFIPYQPTWNAPWTGMAAFAASFHPASFLAWAVPEFAFAIFFVTMMTCVHITAGEEKKTWSQLALVFAMLYAAILIPLYYFYITVVPYHIVNGTTDGLALWLHAYYYPHNIFGAMEGAGYLMMSMSFLLASLIFDQGKLQLWVRWTFVGTGVCTLGLFINPLFPLPLALSLVTAIGGAVLGILAPLLLAILFRRK